MNSKFASYDKIVYFLQGGGALGAYQVGVCETLLDFGCDPDWLIGTSIGAINASIIAGSQPEKRIEKLKEFWTYISRSVPSLPFTPPIEYLQKLQNFFVAQYIATFGIPGFFKPRLYNPWMLFDGTPDLLSYYDTAELHATLKEFINFKLINQKKVRLTLGAVDIESGKEVRFDNFHQKIGPEHIMASAALPPGFPAIKIDNKYYWDGGVSSNTPFSMILEEKIKQRLLCIMVNLFAFPNQAPSSMMEVLKAKKQFEYGSRHQQILHNFLELHLLQHTIKLLPKPKKLEDSINIILKKVAKIGHPSSLNILGFHYNDKTANLVSSDFNFSSTSVEEHWQSGIKDANLALKKPAWFSKDAGESGAIIHEF